MTAPLRAPFPWTGDPMEYATAHLAAGVLRIDDSGCIWRIKHRVAGDWRLCEPRRAENPSGKGYLRVTLHVPGFGLVQVMAHRLVYQWLHGPIPADKQINHRDLDKRNNALDNLEVVSGAENIRHSYEHGRTRPYSRTRVWRGRRCIDGRAVRTMREAGGTLKQIAAVFGISISHAHRLCEKGGGM